MAEISLHEYCEQIESVIEQGRYVEAVAHGKHILEHYPKHAATYRLLGKAMIEADQDEYATDMFHRVLSADPEDMLAWAAMSEIHGRRGELDAAVWCMERTFELAADNRAVEEELRHLYGRRDGVEPQRVQLTRGALARLYLKGDLLSRAVSEIRALLAEHPEQVDLNVALAEALWRNEQRLDASEVCQQVLDELPYCLKVNLLLGEIWASSGREEGQVYLRRAEALDPENLVAQELFGTASPLPEREVWIVPLEYKPPTEEDRPAWMAGLEELPLGAREAALVDITAALEAQIEIPSWLEEVEVTAPAPSGLVEPSAEAPEWLAGIQEQVVEEEKAEAGEEQALALGEPEIPDWLAELGAEVAGEEVEALEEAPSPVAEEALPPAWLEGEGMPSDDEALAWLEGLAAGKEEELQARAEAEGEARMAEIMGRPKPTELAVEEIVPEEAPPAPVPAEVPDWLRELAPPEAAVPEAAPPAIEVALPEAPAPVAEEALPPSWLEGEGIPSGDDALAWLEGLAAGKEEELQAQAEAEGAARMAEIMGRPKPAEPPIAEIVPEEAPPALVPAEVPDWLRELAPPEAAVPEAALPVTEEALPVAEAALPQAPALVAEEAALPSWLEGEGIPSGDDALAWLEGLAAGKEEELQARAEAEGEARMAEIMGRPKPAEPPVAEIVPEAAPPAPVPAEVPDWLRELAPPEAAVPEAAPLAVEAVLPEAPALVAEEAALPSWLEGEGIPSGDDALAWLEGLAAGKEEELQAQAAAEGEARMAEIMGRPKPAEPPIAEIVPEEAPPAPVPAEVPDWLRELAPPEAAVPEAAPPAIEVALPEAPAPVAEEALPPSWLESEGIPSGDEALAWLEGLAAGKEEELQARAEAEGEARVAEIMGRPKPAEPPIAEIVPEEAPPAPVPAEVPDWLRELAPPEAAVPEVVLPAIEAALEEAPAPPVEEPAAPPAEEAFGWTAFGEPEISPVVEETPPVAEPAFGWTAFGEPEAPPEAVLPVEEIAPPRVPEWARLEEVEAPPVIEVPVVEGPPPEEVLEPEVVPPTEQVSATPVIEEIPGVVEMEILEPTEEVVAPPEAPSVGIAAERAYLKEHPRDYEDWLALAQALWQAGERKEALEAYTHVIRAAKFLESVISDLEGYVEQQPDASALQVLGDAYMKEGRLQEALSVYRRALDVL